MGCAMSEPAGSLSRYLPMEVNGWRTAGEDATYDRTTLYDYINGGAEPYLHYGFRQVLVRKFVREGQPPVVVDLFDMGAPENAFGIFSFEREGEEAGLGQGSEYVAGYLRLWQGQFFASVLAEDETPAVKDMVFALGRAIEEAIPKAGGEPDLLKLLPAEGLVRRRVRYFRHHALMNQHYYVADENILRLGDDTEAALAPYAAPDGTVNLLLVRYPSAERAEAALAQFLHVYAPEVGGGTAVRTEDGKWTVAARRAALVVVVFVAPTEERGRSLIESVKPEGGEGG
jgi:hypothetical protein